MYFAHYTYYILFCSIVVFSPGPIAMLLMATGADLGFKKAMPTQLGASSAYFLSLLFFAVGITAILQQYHLVLKAIQYIGVCYILYMAWKQWQNSKIKAVADVGISDVTVGFYQLYYRGLITGLSNPKTIVMFSTVIPQFTRHSSSRVVDVIILSAIFLILQLISGVTYSYFGHAIKSFLHQENHKKIMYRCMAVLLAMVAVMVMRV